MEGKLISKEEMSLKIDTSLMEKRQIIFSADSPSETELVLGDNFEIKVEDGKTYVVRKKPQYPKTYEECLEILGYNVSHTIPINHGHQGLLMMRLQRLLVLRDAYWKMENDWSFKLGSNTDEVVYAITYWGTGLLKNFYHSLSCNKILVFPTEEMRDAFFENSKDLIEQCKELL